MQLSLFHGATMTLPNALHQVTSSLCSDIDFGDQRLNRRFEKVVQTMADNPGASLPELFPNRSDYNACLRLFDSPRCTHQNILDTHASAALDAIEHHPGVVLLLHDTTLFDFSGHTTLEDDLGPIGNGGGRGWIAHQSIAVNPEDRTVFGLVSQILHVREVVPKGEKLAARRERAARESLLWQRGLDEIGATPEHAIWIDVCDRGADIFEFLQQLRDRGRRFIIRSTYNRALGGGPSDEKAKQLLHDRLRSLPALSTYELEIPAKTGCEKRVACLSVSSMSVELRPPHVRRGAQRREPVLVNAARVWEANPPAGVKPLEWLLLTSEPIDTPEQVRQVADWYSCRTQIEEYHKVQKSGLSAEGCQVQSVAKMAALVAVLSVVAVGLMNLRLGMRDPATAGQPASHWVPALWVKVLSLNQTGRAQPDWSVKRFWLELARLGGYQKNPLKHPPGWITIWRGWRTLHALIRYENRSTPKK